MVNKKRFILYVIVVIIVISIIVGGCFLIRRNNHKQIDETSSNDSDVNEPIIDNTNVIVGNRIVEKEIKNQEVKKLFYLVGGYPNALSLNDIFHKNKNLSAYSDLEKLSLILEFDSELEDSVIYMKRFNITDNMLKNLTEEEREFVNQAGDEYTTVEEMERFFYRIYNYQLNTEFINNDIILGNNGDMILGNCPYYTYEKLINAFEYSPNCGGDSDVKYTYLVYDYEDNDNQILVKAVYALTEDYGNGAVYNASHDQIVYDGNDDFYFTDMNIDYFKKFEYIFNKNDNGHYYIKDINILN